jgi:hypothetical protein
MSIRLALRAPLLALVLSSSAWAAPNLLLNGSLEKAAGAPPSNSTGVVYMSGSVNAAAITGWHITAGTVDLVPDAYWDAPTGTHYCVDLIGTPGTAVASPALGPLVAAVPQSQLGQITQEVSLTAGETYQLTFDMSVNPMTGPLREYETTKRLLVEAVSAGGESTTVLASREYSLTRGTRHPENMQWLADTAVDPLHRTFTFTATGDTLIRFTALMPLNAPNYVTPSNVYCGPAIGNLGLTLLGGGGPVPEPASLGLLGVGASVLLFKRRRGR